MPSKKQRRAARNARRRENGQTDTGTRAERRRAERGLGNAVALPSDTQQLRDLARARADEGQESAREWFARFEAHKGTPEACPTGHPELFIAQFMGVEIDEDYVCPACGDTPRFGPVETNIPELAGSHGFQYVED